MAFRDSLGAALGDLACSSAKSYRSLTQSVPLAGALLGGAIPSIGSYLLERLYCNKDPYTQPFKPGLCSIRYNVTITYRISGHPITQFNGTFTKFSFVWGPVGTASFTVQDVDDPGGRTLLSISLSSFGDANGSQLSAPVRLSFPPEEFHTLATCVILNTESIPANGSDDPNCGGTYPVVPYRPEDHTYRVPIPYTPPGGVSITLPFTAIVGLFYVDANLNLNMPVSFKLDATANIALNFNFEFEGNLNLTTGDTNIKWIEGDQPNQPPPSLPPSSRPPITSPTNPAPPKPPSIPDATEDPQDAINGRELIGVIVTSTFKNDNRTVSSIVQGDNPDIQVPAVGYVSFAIKAGDGSVGWTNDIPVKNLRAYIPCPFNSRAIKVTGTPKPEFTWTLTPIYERVLQLAGG